MDSAYYRDMEYLVCEEPTENPYEAFGDEDGFIDSFDESVPDSEIYGFRSGDPMFHTHADDRSRCTWHVDGDDPFWRDVLHRRIRRAEPERHPAIYAEHFVKLALSKP